MKYIKNLVISHNICRYLVHYAWQVELPLQWVIDVMRGQLRHKGKLFFGFIEPLQDKSAKYISPICEKRCPPCFFLRSGWQLQTFHDYLFHPEINDIISSTILIYGYQWNSFTCLDTVTRRIYLTNPLQIVNIFYIFLTSLAGAIVSVITYSCAGGDIHVKFHNSTITIQICSFNLI